MGFVRLAGIIGVLVTLSAAASPARAADVPRQESAEAQLKLAVSTQRKSIRKQGEERKAILAEAIAAYAKVKEYFPQDHRQCATAALRIGDLHRSLKEADRAIAAYNEALQYAEETRTGARALEQIGHVQRRSKRIDEAMASYRAVADRFAAEASVAARSLVWAAKCQLAKKDVAGGRQTLRSVIERFPEESGAVVDAFDLIGTSLVDEKKIAEAEAVLKECREMFKEELDGNGHDDDDGVKRDVERMRVAKLIEREKARAETKDDED